METWKERLAGRMPPELAREIDVYELQLELRRQGKVEEKLFAETRLRRGAYGQRYDSGHRNDGTGTKQLAYPCGDLTKGPDTVWDAPGMQRIKIPFGGLNPEQMETLADLAEEYSDGICHITTRQDVQLHYVHIEDTPTIMRRLAAVGITTREACGNSVRNVTACPVAGVCQTETFDVTPYARALAFFLLGHPDTQDFGRKFKIAFSGCRDRACALVTIHDLGFIARTRRENGSEKRGFEVWVGGGLGAVPYEAKPFEEFVPEEEILPLAQAVGRVFARLGEKRNRSRARLKFLVAKLGMEEFRRLVLEERKRLPEDERWTAYIPEAHRWSEVPGPGSNGAEPAPPPEGFEEWMRTNVYRQKQPGYAVATVTLPLGDVTSWQMRRLADLARRYAGGNVRTTVEQNIVFRWVAERDLPALYRDLCAIGLGEPGAGTIVDVVACPGTDTCKLGIASSRGLAAELRQRLSARAWQLDEAVRGLHIKISGCFNSCGQHHICDLGFYGVSRNVRGYTVPHFQVVLGGQWEANAGNYGLAMGAVPSKNIPEVVDRLTTRYLAERGKDETFRDFVTRVGKRELKAMLADLTQVPPYEQDRSYYSDWRDPREFTLGDMGKGECAGEVVTAFEFDIQEAERLVFEAQLQLDEGAVARAEELAYEAMLQAARALVKTELIDPPADAGGVVGEFRKRFYDTRLFWDPFAGGKFAHYLFRRFEEGPGTVSRESARQRVEEAQLFVEAAHSCHAKLAERGAKQPLVAPQPGAQTVSLTLD